MKVSNAKRGLRASRLLSYYAAGNNLGLLPAAAQPVASVALDS